MIKSVDYPSPRIYFSTTKNNQKVKKMLENIKQNKIATLEPKRHFIINDINMKNYDMASLSTIISVSAIFLLSMKILVLTGI